MGRKLTHKEFIDRLKEINPNISVIGNYAGRHIKITAHCSVCDNTWSPVAGSLLNGYGCPACGRRKNTEALTMTDDEFKKRLDEAWHGKIISLDEYKNGHTKLKFKCSCGNIWEALPCNLIHGHGCYYCSREATYKAKIIDTDEVDSKVFQKHGNDIIRLSDCVGTSKELVTWKCNICNYVWESIPYNVIKGGCRRCADKNNCSTNDEIDIHIKNLYGDDIKRVDNYTKATDEITWHCSICHNDFKKSFKHLKNKSGCPLCAVSNSKGETRIKQYLDINNINYTTQYRCSGCRDYKPLPFDFYLPDYNIFIEYDGIQHFEPKSFSNYVDKDFEFYKLKIHDHIKNNYCTTNNIKLIRIPYWDYNNIESILNKNLITI